MPDMMFQALDLTGLNETAEQVRTIVQEAKAEIEEGLNSLSYAKPNGIYPEMTVGAVIGADETAQWAQRTTEGSGSATVRSVQGDAEVIDGELVPVQIAGIQSKDAQGNALDGIEWQAKTLRAAGSIADELTDDALVTRVGVVDLGTLTWTAYNASTYPNLWYANIPERANSSATTSNDTNWNGYPKNTLSYRSSWNGIRDNDKSWTIYPVNSSYPKRIWINDSDYAGLTSTQVASALSGKMAFYELATPTTQPISPALPMTYKVQANGSETIIVPSGEISAAPIITIAEPVNMSTELAQIWAAIEALQGSRGSALGSVRTDSDVSSTEVKEAPTMDETQTIERESEI